MRVFIKWRFKYVNLWLVIKFQVFLIFFPFSLAFFDWNGISPSGNVAV